MDLEVEVSDSVSGMLFTLGVIIKTADYMEGLLCAQHTVSFIYFTDENVQTLKH